MEKDDRKQSVNFKKSVIIVYRTMGLVWQVDKMLFILFLILVIIPGVVPFINAYIYKLIIDYVVNAIRISSVNLNALFFLFALRFLTYFIQQLSFIFQTYVDNLLWTKFPIVFNNLLFTKLASLDVQYFEDIQFKDLLSKVRESYNYRPQSLFNNMFYSIQSFIQVIIAIVAVLELNWWLIFPILLVTIPDFFLQVRESKITWNIWGWSSTMRKRFFNISNMLQDDMQVKEIKIFGLGSWFVNSLVNLQKQFYKENKQVANKYLILDTGVNILSTFVFVGIEIYVISQTLLKRITVGDIGFYTTVINNFQNGLGGFFRSINQVYDNSLYVSSIFDLFDLQPRLVNSPTAQRLELSKPPVIEFKNITFRYKGSKSAILQNFSLTIKPGEKIALVGENGAGKSTLIKLLVRFYDPEEGEVLINDINLKDLDITDWHKNIGVLFQDFNRYEYTVKENIQFGKIDSATDDNLLNEAVKSSGASDVVDSLEKRYEQMLGKTFKEGIDLSTGQWQKIALARAFYRNAPILVLDEPTASIDAKAEAEIFDRVEKLSRDKTVIIISHRFSTVRQADRILVLDEGKIIEQGSHAELMQKKGLYSELFELQAKGYK